MFQIPVPPEALFDLPDRFSAMRLVALPVELARFRARIVETYVISGIDRKMRVLINCRARPILENPPKSGLSKPSKNHILGTPLDTLANYTFLIAPQPRKHGKRF